MWIVVSVWSYLVDLRVVTGRHLFCIKGIVTDILRVRVENLSGIWVVDVAWLISDIGQS